MIKPTPKDILKKIQDLTVKLVESSLIDDQEWPKLTTNGTTTEVTTNNPINSSILKSVDYSTLYKEQLNGRSFNFKFLDGALLQMSYLFQKEVLIKHRLAFLPAPDLEIYQSAPELYLQEVLFADIVGSQVATAPIRIDFDIRPQVSLSDDHPATHMTLGQYQHCRIPVSAPVTPNVFVDFIIRHFYSMPGFQPLNIDVELNFTFPLSDPPINTQMAHFISPGIR